MADAACAAPLLVLLSTRTSCLIAFAPPFFGFATGSVLNKWAANNIKNQWFAENCTAQLQKKKRATASYFSSLGRL
jgi:hypothetical protein